MYCAFNKYNVPNGGQNHKRMEDSLVSELQHQLEELKDKHLHSVYFGGGTPSLARPQMVEKILKVLEPLRRKGGADVEITLEMNPSVSVSH